MRWMRGIRREGHWLDSPYRIAAAVVVFWLVVTAIGLYLSGCAAIPNSGPPAWAADTENGGQVILVWQGTHCLVYYCAPDRERGPCQLLGVESADEDCKPDWIEVPQ